MTPKLIMVKHTNPARIEWAPVLLRTTQESILSSITKAGQSRIAQIQKAEPSTGIAFKIGKLIMLLPLMQHSKLKVMPITKLTMNVLSQQAIKLRIAS